MSFVTVFRCCFYTGISSVAVLCISKSTILFIQQGAVKESVPWSQSDQVTVCGREVHYFASAKSPQTKNGLFIPKTRFFFCGQYRVCISAPYWKHMKLHFTKLWATHFATQVHIKPSLLTLLAGSICNR